MRPLILSIVAMFGLSLCSCKGSESDKPVDPILLVSPTTAALTAAGGSTGVTVTMNGTRWVATSDQTWCTVTTANSGAVETKLTINVAANSVKAARTAKVTFTMDSKTTVVVTISQEAAKDLYPDYSNPIAADNTGMTSTAKVLAAKMVVGWNLGNSLEVPTGETAWGNPKTTQALINGIKNAGINAVRIPCAWMSNLENGSTCKISTTFLARVKEVVDYCYKNGMYVIINCHWDGGWLENNPTYAAQDVVNQKQKAIWQQIAVYFRNYDEHLLFAGTNEVHADGTATTENFEVQMSYNQTFVDAVRSTGGKNAYRNIVVQSYNTNIDQAVAKLKMPTDAIQDRMFAEVHYYDPWDFCGLEKDETWGTVKNFWGASYAQYGAISGYGQEDYMQAQFQKMKAYFVDKGYPVILGEFGANRRNSLTGDLFTHHQESRAFYYSCIAKYAKQNGIVPFAWDNGGNSGITMGLFNRNDGTVYDMQVVPSYVNSATATSYPF